MQKQDAHRFQIALGRVGGVGRGYRVTLGKTLPRTRWTSCVSTSPTPIPSQTQVEVASNWSPGGVNLVAVCHVICTLTSY